MENRSLKITNKLWQLPLILGLFFILFGGIMLKKPLTSFYTLSIIIGITLIISGVVEIYFFNKNRKNLNNWSFYLSGGVLDLLLGIILITNPKIIFVVFTLLVSIWLIYKAVLAFAKAVELKNTANKNWVWLLVIGILILVLAAVLIWKPQILGAALAFWVAISFIVFGCYRIYLAFQIKNYIKK